MKTYPAILFIAFLLFGGCMNQPPPGPPPFLGILSARKVGTGPSETASVAVKVHYENLEPEKYEIKIGFGYTPANKMIEVGPNSAGVYAVAYTEVVHSASGDIEATIDPVVVRNVGGTLDGKIYAILSPYPHGKEWKVLKYHIVPLDPE